MDTTDAINPTIEASWKLALKDQFDATYFHHLKQFLLEEKKIFTVLPPGNQIFAAFNTTPLDKVKVVILGQDPYHGPGQAHGLCFSVPDGIRRPPSLINIFKEIEQDLGIKMSDSSNLSHWAKQGVLLLNATLTVRMHEAGSHQGKGWERFTDAVIQTVSEQCEHVVFMLWGRFARAKKVLLNPKEHLILEAAHPSPLSAHNGFFGCQHFSRANEYLSKYHGEMIDWSL